MLAQWHTTPAACTWLLHKVSPASRVASPRRCSTPLHPPQRLVAKEAHDRSGAAVAQPAGSGACPTVVHHGAAAGEQPIVGDRLRQEQHVGRQLVLRARAGQAQTIIAIVCKTSQQPLVSMLAH